MSSITISPELIVTELKLYRNKKFRNTYPFRCRDSLINGSTPRNQQGRRVRRFRHCHLPNVQIDLDACVCRSCDKISVSESTLCK